MQQAHDFGEECAALDAALAPLAEADFDRVTLFKDWTINDVLQHLHFFNLMAVLFGFRARPVCRRLCPVQEGRAAVRRDPWWAVTDRMLGGLKGQALRRAWRDDLGGDGSPFCRCRPEGPGEMGGAGHVRAVFHHGAADGDLGPWPGRSSMCWGWSATEGDRIRNIAHLGVSTYGWTFVNRGEAVPEPAPFVRLRAPSGRCLGLGRAIGRRAGRGAMRSNSARSWPRHATSQMSDLTVSGPNATRWMAIAQCFAGPPNDPPAPGTRVKA